MASDLLRTAAAAESCIYPVWGILGIGRQFYEGNAGVGRVCY